MCVLVEGEVPHHAAWVQEAERKIPMNYASRYRNSALSQQSYLPFKVSSELCDRANSALHSCLATDTSTALHSWLKTETSTWQMAGLS